MNIVIVHHMIKSMNIDQDLQMQSNNFRRQPTIDELLLISFNSEVPFMISPRLPLVKKSVVGTSNIRPLSYHNILTCLRNITLPVIFFKGTCCYDMEDTGDPLFVNYHGTQIGSSVT